MEYLTSIIESNTFPVLTAFVLGLMTAISPCPLATNITAIGFISKDIENRNRVFYNGVVYTLGRAISYTALAMVLFYGADQFRISGFFQQYGEKIIGPLLIVIGLFMLDVLKIKFPGMSSLTERMNKKGINNYWDVLLLGMIFALAFCPYSGVLFFGMLIPMTISSGNAIVQPVVFAIATGIPVILFAWLIAYTLSSVGSFYNKIKTFEIWLRRVIAVLFIGVGIYYVIIIYL
ncbi:MAG: cytochrome C biogenesis protein [Marinilabiliales bacterium]|nr:MAG: cytochrome C biogenesis protein [Marinilabiliales bacterium]